MNRMQQHGWASLKASFQGKTNKVVLAKRQGRIHSLMVEKTLDFGLLHGLQRGFIFATQLHDQVELVHTRGCLVVEALQQNDLEVVDR